MTRVLTCTISRHSYLKPFVWKMLVLMSCLHQGGANRQSWATLRVPLDKKSASIYEIYCYDERFSMYYLYNDLTHLIGCNILQIHQDKTRQNLLSRQNLSHWSQLIRWSQCGHGIRPDLSKIYLNMWRDSLFYLQLFFFYYAHANPTENLTRLKNVLQVTKLNLGHGLAWGQSQLKIVTITNLNP